MLDLDKLIEEIMRCKPDWQSLHEWRRNYIWVQKPINKIDNSINLCHNKFVGQLQFILKVRNPKTIDDGGKPTKYINALLELMRPWNRGASNKIISIIKMQLWLIKMSKNPCALGALRIFFLDTILKNIHIRFDGKKIFYVNNYSN